METSNFTKVTVEALINAPLEKVWTYWNEPEHIKQWAFAADDWYAPYADNDLRIDGTFKTTMAAKDGSVSFDFGGTYSNVEPHRLIEYGMADGRQVKVEFINNGDSTHVVETFDAEQQNSIEMQKGGWQMILNNFKKHVEA